MADLRNTSMLYKLLPGLLWLQGYRRDMFKSDIVAGVTIAFMLIPQGMAYAVVAGLPPEYGPLRLRCSTDHLLFTRHIKQNFYGPSGFGLNSDFNRFERLGRARF